MSRLTTKQRRSRARAHVGEDTGWRVVAVQVDASGVVTFPKGYKGREVRVHYSYGGTAVLDGVVAQVRKSHRRRPPPPRVFTFGQGTLYLEGKPIGMSSDISIEPVPEVYGRAWMEPVTITGRVARSFVNAEAVERECEKARA